MSASKKTSAKSGTSKKAAAKKTAAAKPAPKKARAPKPGPRCIRNLLGVQQNLRLQGDRDKPYAITLRPRGNRGDAVFVPLACQSDTAFVAGLDRQFEIITEAEYKDLQSTYPPIGYTGRRPLMPNLVDGSLEPVDVKVVRPEKTIKHRTEDPHAAVMEQQANRPERRTGPVGPRVVQMPGGEGAMGSAPPGGGDNAALMAQVDAQAAARRPARGR